MPTELEQFIEKLNRIIKDLKRRQSDALARHIATSFTLGYQKGKIVPGGYPNERSLQRRAIEELTTTNLGYLDEFDSALGDKLKGHLQEVIKVGGGYEDVRRNLVPYVEEVFGENGQVTIDRTGQTREIITVDQDGNLHREQKTIQEPYTTSVKAYSEMLSRTVAHSSYAKGRATGYKASGIEKLRVVVMQDERARASHLAVHGKIIEIGSPEEQMILDLHSEPNCRCRTIPYLDNNLDTPNSVYEKQKDKFDLKFENGEWMFNKLPAL